MPEWLFAILAGFMTACGILGAAFICAAGDARSHSIIGRIIMVAGLIGICVVPVISITASHELMLLLSPDAENASASLRDGASASP